MDKGEIAITKDLMAKTMKYVPPEKRAYYDNIKHDDKLKEADFALASYNL